MKKTILSRPPLLLVGVSVRTSNKAELDQNTAKIGNTIKSFYEKKIFDKIKNLTDQKTTYSVYTDYERDYTQGYTYFFGQEVSSFDGNEALNCLKIPEQNYAKFTAGPGAMPDVCIKAWQEIWQMSSHDLGGERGYIADFEVYDERSKDIKKAILDIYVGI